MVELTQALVVPDILAVGIGLKETLATLVFVQPLAAVTKIV